MNQVDFKQLLLNSSGVSLWYYETSKPSYKGGRNETDFWTKERQRQERISRGMISKAEREEKTVAKR